MVYNTQVTLEFNHTCYCPYLVDGDICIWQTTWGDIPLDNVLQNCLIRLHSYR